MTEEKKNRITVDKNKETRSKEISKMISEGGLGAEKYYDIKKEREKDSQSSEEE